MNRGPGDAFVAEPPGSPPGVGVNSGVDSAVHSLCDRYVEGVAALDPVHATCWGTAATSRP
ncbi:MAG: hypothetical protein M3P85_01380 [Actinomycetota bacterium]|nr:hypothetical protein [Actinomycetota bacterium]